MDRRSTPDGLPTATLRETIAIISQVMAPNVAKGVIRRRPNVVGMVERFGLDAKGIRQLQALSKKYGRGPLMLKVPGKKMAVVLDPADANHVLEHTPEPFATDEALKRSALGHFEPDMALVSHGEARQTRRQLNERVLQSGCPHHLFADAFTQVVEEEADALVARTNTRFDELDWPTFQRAWERIVRRVVLGDSARDDRTVTRELVRLRKAANWGFMHPKRKRLQQRFEQHLAFYYQQAEPHSLMAMLFHHSTEETDSDQAPLQQVPQWLFAFDPAGMAAFRALALLCAHPEFAARALDDVNDTPPPDMDCLKASVLEALRLWPTTPLILRQSTQPTQWTPGEMPAHTSVLIHTPYFHRDERYLHAAHRFTPEMWLRPDGERRWPLVPFSGGPGICPGRHIVLLVTSRLLAALLWRARWELHPPGKLSSETPMPGLLSPFHLRFRLERFSSDDATTA